MDKSTILGSNMEKVLLLQLQKKPKEEAVGGEKSKQTNKNLLFERTPKKGGQDQNSPIKPSHQCQRIARI